MNIHPRKPHLGGYTLVEVLVAAVILGTAISAAVSMASTLRLQQELSWRVAIAINYQETAARLWQMGQTEASGDPHNLLNIMPGTDGNPKLKEALYSIDPDIAVTTATLGTATQGSLAKLEGASSAVQVSGFPAANSGGITTFRFYRPSVR